MTPQQVLDKVTEHLFTQGIASVRVLDDRTTQCAYRGQDGLMCAIGCLIPDSLYTTQFEGMPALTVAIVLPVNNSSMDLVSIFAQNGLLLDDLQKCHDSYMPRFVVDDTSDVYDIDIYKSDMRLVARRLRDIANDHGLKLPLHLIPKQYCPVD